jgi:SAM-dependent methyltransferase
MEAIYDRPGDYDLEHEGDDEDVAFYLGLLDRWQPRRVMELAAGSGRVTIPLARHAAARGIQVVGLEREGPMLEEASRKSAELDEGARGCLTFMTGDMREWRTDQPFDLVITPCSSLPHLLTLDDQLAAWLLRYKTTRYVPHEQRAAIRFLYDRFPDSTSVDRYVSDFDSHVYHPRDGVGVKPGD